MFVQQQTNTKMAKVIFFISIILFVETFELKNYIYGHQILICDGDINFNTTVEQHLIITEMVTSAGDTFKNTKISIKKLKTIESLPKLQTYKTVILTQHSPLCSGRLHIDDPKTLEMILDIRELSLELPNIVIVPHKIVKYFGDGGVRLLDGLADYGGAFLKPLKRFPNQFKSRNIVFVSSSILLTDGPLGLLQLFLHEIGHTFAPKEMFAYHDPDDESYNEQVKGTYIMSTYRLTIQGVNNFRYSPATISMFEKYINKVFWDSEYHNGWYIEQFKLCGNGIVDREYGEQCECLKNVKNTLKFCECMKCKLRAGFRCIDTADRCCTSDGKIAEPGTECRVEELRYCIREQFCDGKSADCPQSDHFEEGTKCEHDKICSGEGSCISDKCNRQEDSCRPENVCMFGCRNNHSTGCVERYSKKDGSTCTMQHDIGQCIKGVCHPLPKRPQFKMTENEKSEIEKNTFRKHPYATVFFTLIFYVIAFTILFQCVNRNIRKTT